MTYLPARALVGFEDITTSEQLSGRNVNGSPSYIKLLKQTGALGTGTVNIAHGITGLTRLVQIEAFSTDATPQHIGFPFPQYSTVGNVFALHIFYANATNVAVGIGTSWAASNALTTVWVIIEYLK